MGPMTQMQAGGRVLSHGTHDPDARCGGTKVSRIQMSPAVHVSKDMWRHAVGALPWDP